MKKILIFALLAIAVSSMLISCNDTNGEITDSDTENSGGEIEADSTEAPAEENPFTLPANMDELRANIIEYFNAMSAVKWIAPEKIDFTQSSGWTTSLIYERGQTYYGLPYTSGRAGVSLQEFLLYLDEKDTYIGPIGWKDIVGGDCGSPRRAWAWGGALCNEGMLYADFEFMRGENKNKPKQIIVKVGDFDDSKYTSDTPTTQNIIAVNGEDIMCEAYAKLKPCDFIGKRFILSSNGKIAQHICMIVEEATVVRTNAGKISPSKSYIVYSEQTSTVYKVDGKNTTWRLNVKVSFSELLRQGYIPMSTATLQKGVIEEPYIDISGTTKPENFANSDLIKGSVKSNYNIFIMEAFITDKDGNVVSSAVSFPYSLSAMVTEMNFSKKISELTPGTYHYKLTATIGFGTKTLADFDFIKK